MNKQDWTYKKLGEVATFSRGLTYSKSDVVVESSNKVLRSNNIDLATHSLNFDDIVCLKDKFEIPVDKILQPNDIFICMSNGSTQHLGKVAFVEKKIDYAFGGFMGAIHPDTNEIYPKYAYYYCLSSEYRRSLSTVLNGININNIKWSDLSKFPIPVPPIGEQERIVAELDLLSGIIEKKKEQLKAYDQLAQSIFYTMFGDISDTAFPIKCLNDVCEFIKDGTHQTPTYTDDKENGVKFLSAKDVVGGTINWDNIKYIPIDLHKELHKRIAPQRNDILLCKNGTTGICAIVETDEIFDIYVSLALLRPRKPNCPKYLLYAINNPLTKEQFNRSLKGVGVPNLHLGEIKKARIIYPPLSLQQEFAEKVEAIERQKALVQQSIEETQTMFDYTMDKYFG